MAADRPTRYLLALGFLAGALLLRVMLDPWLQETLSHPTVFTAILLAAWYCGIGPAALIAVLGYPAVEILVLDHSWPAIGPFYLASSLGLYAALALIIVFFVSRFRRERDRLNETQAKLKESGQRMRASFDNAALGIYETDDEDRVIAVNERMCEILGYSREELLGKGVDETTAPEDRPRGEELSKRLREGRLERFDLEKRAVRRDGTHQWVHVTASAVRDDAGRYLYSIRTVEDIHERKSAEQTVSLLWQAVQSAANSIVLTERSGRILWVNPAFTRLTGYTIDDVLAQNPRILKSGQQQPAFYKDLWATILRGESWQGQLVNRRKDGSLYNEEMTITPVRASGDEITHFVSIKQDITERMRAEESLRTARISAERAKADAEEASRAKDRFLAVLSHELRTPLTPVLAAVQLMQRTPGVAEDMRERLDIISRNVQLEARLIDDLLDLTRIVQGKIVLDRKAVDLCTVIERAVEISQPDIDARRLHFGVELMDTPLRVEGDLSRLQQVVWNLLTNAVKFTPDGGCVGIRARRVEGRAVVEVFDSGIGIGTEALARIFDAFEQGDRAVTRQFGGLGLGLAIAKRLVDLHGGAISALSEGKDKGASFRIELPLSNAQVEPRPSQPVSTVPGSSGRILVVEDNGDTATTMKMLLEAFGYAVETAGDVAQALESVAARDFDLLVSDLGLPDRSGLDLMRELRHRGMGLKGIALSGFGQEEDVRRSHEAGFSLHLTKPVDVDALIAAVARVL